MTGGSVPRCLRHAAQIGLIAALIIALLGRPIVLLLAENLGLVLFGLISLVLNGLLVLLTTQLLPGFAVDTLSTAFLLAFGLAVNTRASGLLGINDDDSFYRNVILWLERVPLSDHNEPGTVQELPPQYRSASTVFDFGLDNGHRRETHGPESPGSE